MFGIDCAQSAAHTLTIMLKNMRSSGRLVGLSNPRNRPRVDGLGDVYDQMFASIVDQRLPPGSKLNELKLCEIFNVGRRQIGQVLLRLSHDELVDLKPNRGAFVAAPDVEAAKAIFEVRRAIEAEIVRMAAAKLSREQLTRLKRNVEQEAAARRAGRTRDAIRLSGEFHILLGDACGNLILAKLIRQLVARTSLVVSLYDNQNTMSCWHDDHQQFIRLVEDGAVAAAVSLMRKHLVHIEESLDLDRAPARKFDLVAIYSPGDG